jgi:hypothetical protein
VSRLSRAVQWIGENSVVMLGGHRTGINGTSNDYVDSWRFNYELSGFQFNCTSGYDFSAGSVNTSTCIPCHVGHFKKDSMTSCSVCANGKFSS